MNIAFIVDNSLSMSQVFDKKLTFLDLAKQVVETFIQTREKNKKIDKYLLLSSEYITNSKESNKEKSDVRILSNWEHPIQHFIYQLKNINISYKKGNILNSILSSSFLLNKYNLIPFDKVVNGRLPSKLERTSIILLTDNGESYYHNTFLSSKEVINTETYNNNNENYLFHTYHNINFESSLNIIYLNDKSIVNNTLNKVLSNIIFSKSFYISDFNQIHPLVNIIHNQIDVVSFNVIFEFQYKQINKRKYISQAYSNLIKTEKWPIPLNYHIKEYINNFNVTLNTTNNVLSNKSINFTYPHFSIGSIVYNDITPHLSHFDRYEIFNEDLIRNLLSINMSIKLKDINKIEFFWDVFNKKEKFPFGILILDINKDNSNRLVSDNISLFDYYNSNTKDIRLYLYISVFNFHQFFQIINNIQYKSTSENIYLLLKYIEVLPEYYISYIKSFFEENSFLNSNTILSQIPQLSNYKYLNSFNKTISLYDSKQLQIFNELLKSIEEIKNDHLIYKSTCCNKDVLSHISSMYHMPSTISLYDFISENIKITLNSFNHKSKYGYIIDLNPLSDNNFYKKYGFYLKFALRNPFDENENQESKDLHINFGNPFKKQKEIGNIIDFKNSLNIKQLDNSELNSTFNESDNKTEVEDKLIKDNNILESNNKIKNNSNDYDLPLLEFKKRFISSNNSQKYIDDKSNNHQTYIEYTFKYVLNKKRLLDWKNLIDLKDFTNKLIMNRYKPKEFINLVKEIENTLRSDLFRSYLEKVYAYIKEIGGSNIVYEKIGSILNK